MKVRIDETATPALQARLHSMQIGDTAGSTVTCTRRDGNRVQLQCTGPRGWRPTAFGYATKRSPVQRALLEAVDGRVVGFMQPESGSGYLGLIIVACLFLLGVPAALIFIGGEWKQTAPFFAACSGLGTLIFFIAAWAARTAGLREVRQALPAVLRAIEDRQ